VHISSLPRKKNPLFTQDKILVLLTVAIADFFLIDTDEVIGIGKTLKKIVLASSDGRRLGLCSPLT